MKIHDVFADEVVHFGAAVLLPEAVEVQVFAGAIKDVQWDGESKRIVVVGAGSNIKTTCVMWAPGNAGGEMVYFLADGLGDTLRVSLTEAPEKEIPVCYSILQSLGLRKTMVEYVACPSCGRTLFNLEEVLHKVRDATQHLQGLDIAVMGCIVNGPGEMADADYGYVGKGPGTIALYRGREEIGKVPEADGVEALIQLIKEDGRWVEPA